MLPNKTPKKTFQALISCCSSFKSVPSIVMFFPQKSVLCFFSVMTWAKDSNRSNFCFCFFSVLSLFLIVRRNRSTDGNTFHHPNKTEVENFGLYKKESQLWACCNLTSVWFSKMLRPPRFTHSHHAIFWNWKECYSLGKLVSNRVGFQ